MVKGIAPEELDLEISEFLDSLSNAGIRIPAKHVVKEEILQEIIQSELDIYIPSLKLAFEIQGIFHYEPIFGQEKLDQIQKNDLEKVKKCKALGIKLICIDTRKQKTFSKISSTEFLNIVVQSLGLEPNSSGSQPVVLPHKLRLQ